MNKKLDIYVANLGVNYIKLHNLHWNVVGKTFRQAHEYLEDLYDETTESLDKIAEQQKMSGEYPKASLKDYLEIATIKEIESKDYTVQEAYEMVLEDLKLMRTLGTEIRNKADEDGEFTLVALMEEEVDQLEKHIWFVESSLK